MRSTQSMLAVAKEDDALLDSLLVSDCNGRPVVAIFIQKVAYTNVFCKTLIAG